MLCSKDLVILACALTLSACLESEDQALRQRLSRAELTALLCDASKPPCTLPPRDEARVRKGDVAGLLRQRSREVRTTSTHDLGSPPVSVIFLEATDPSADREMTLWIAKTYPDLEKSDVPCISNGCLNIFAEASFQGGSDGMDQLNRFGFAEPHEIKGMRWRHPSYLADVTALYDRPSASTAPMLGTSLDIRSMVMSKGQSTVRECSIYPTRQLFYLKQAVSVCMAATTTMPCSVRCIDLNFDQRAVRRFRAPIEQDAR